MLPAYQTGRPPAVLTRRAPPTGARRCGGRRAGDARQHEAVPALATDGLQHGRRDARLACEALGERAHAADALVVARLVDHGTAAHDVVDHDDRTRAREAEGPVEIRDVGALVGIDEDHVEGRTRLRRERRQRVERRTDADLDARREPGAGDVGACDGGMAGIRFEAQQPAVVR
jgi:hypothetical protein